MANYVKLTRSGGVIRWTINNSISQTATSMKTSQLGSFQTIISKEYFFCSVSFPPTSGQIDLNTGTVTSWNDGGIDQTSCVEGKIQ